MEEHPGTSARCAAQQLGHKRETVRKTLKEEGFFTYRISVLHKLKPEDYSPHYDYCDWFFKKFGHNVETMSTIFNTGVITPEEFVVAGDHLVHHSQHGMGMWGRKQSKIVFTIQKAVSRHKERTMSSLLSTDGVQ